MTLLFEQGNCVSKYKFTDNLIMFNILMTLSKLSVLFNHNLAIMYMIRKFFKLNFMPLKVTYLNLEIGLWFYEL